MNIPLLTVNEFIKNINQNENQIKSDSNESNTLKIKIDILKIKVNDRKILELINQLIPDLKEEKQYNILLWARLALYLRAKHSINTNAIINLYLSWRKNQGKSFTHVFNKESDKIISIDYFMIRSITRHNALDFHKEWVCIRNPRLTQKNIKKDFSATYGPGSIDNVIFCLEESTNNKTIDFLEKIKETNGKKYISYASRDKLYDALKSKHNLFPERTTFKGIASKFVISKYKGR